MVTVFAAVAGLAACRGTPTAFTWGRTPAAGATTTCPEGAVDLTGDRRPSTDHVRCSYADASFGQATVRGKVLEDAGIGLGNAIEGAEVALVPIDDAGRAGAARATSRTDAQGGFTLRARIGEGRWAVAAGGALSPPWTWTGRGPWDAAGIVVRMLPPTP